MARKRYITKDKVEHQPAAWKAGDVLPEDAVAEARVAAALLADEDGSVMRLALTEGLEPDCFVDKRRRMIVGAVYALVSRGEAAGALAVCQFLDGQGDLEAAGGAAFVVELSNTEFSWVELRTGVRRLVELMHRRRAVLAARGLLDGVLGGDGEVVERFRTMLEEALSAKTASALPPLVPWSDVCLDDEQREVPEELIAGVLHRGGTMMVGGGSKSFKTWMLLDLALAVASGQPWLGFRTTQVPVLYLNMELQRPFFEQRITQIVGIRQVDNPPFYTWNLRGYARDIREMMPLILARVHGLNIGLIVLDPIYKLLGDRDENANGEIADMLNEVGALATRTGAAVLWGHHFSKGNQAGKAAMDRVSGAGAWSRDPDALVTLTPHEQDDHFTMEFVVR
ncbi:MAG: hypothetical protein D6692_04060, partial [Planctomycetota bacterium]